MLELLPVIGLAFIVFSLIAVLTSDNWRWKVLFLSFQYFGCFLLLLKSLPMVLAASKLIAGLIAGVLLGMAMAGLSPEESRAQGYTQNNKRRIFDSRRLFRLFMAGIVVLVVLSIISAINNFVPGISQEQSYATVLLIGLSLVQMSLISHPFDTVVGLLLLLSGFEILYSVVETSALVIGLLAVVDLGLALAGAYLIVSPTLGRAE
ncbi:MAG: hypothetical protein JW908_01225 [Anaerolineales bacterium]|nr:hypothetical protein [Anaerolineales bacterium]